MPAALLERSTQLAALDERLAVVRAGGGGRLVLVGGEAGIGKTALVRAFCARAQAPRVLWGACDALFTPRPLGPLLDVAEQAGGALAALGDDGTTPSALVVALAGELRRRRGTVVVIEDLHWADEATLDSVRLLARRIDGLHALVLATFRDDLERDHPLRVVLGEISTATAERMRVAPLSVDAVAALAGAQGVDAAELHRTTAGNPFFVTEVLAAGGAEVPDSVRDAVLARAARLDPGARRVLEAVAIVPSQAELWLLETMAGEDVARLEACLAAGMLRADGDAVGLATVYRTLQQLADDGDVDVLRTADGEAVYRRCSTGRHHHHLVCRSCGRTVELDAAAVERWARRMGEEHGFSDVDHVVELFGTCRECTATHRHN
jgi:Fe2+ or Zn2+ uptake regulation protein